MLAVLLVLLLAAAGAGFLLLDRGDDAGPTDTAGARDDAPVESVAFDPVATGATPSRLELSPDGRTGYVANSGDDTLSVVDLRSGDVEQVPLAGRPISVEVSSDGSRVYVPCRQAGAVVVLDATRRPLREESRIELGDVVVGAITLSDDDATLYVPADDGTVSVVDTATGEVREQVPVGTSPARVQLTPDGERGLVADQSTGTVVAFDTDDPVGSARPITMPAAPLDLTVDDAGERAYVVLDSPGPVQVLDLTTTPETLVAELDVPGDHGRARLDDEGRLWVPDFIGGAVHVVDPGNGEVVERVELESPSGPVTLAPDRGTVFLGDAGAGEVVAVDTGSLVAQRLDTADVPSSLTVSPDGRTLYVVGYAEGDERQGTVAALALD